MNNKSAFFWALFGHLFLAVFFIFTFYEDKPIKLSFQESMSAQVIGDDEMALLAAKVVQPSPLKAIETYEHKQIREIAEQKAEEARLAAIESQRLLELEQARIVEEEKIAQRQQDAEQKKQEETLRLADIERQRIEQQNLKAKIDAIRKEVARQQQQLVIKEKMEADKRIAQQKKIQADKIKHEKEARRKKQQQQKEAKALAKKQQQKAQEKKVQEQARIKKEQARKKAQRLANIKQEKIARLKRQEALEQERQRQVLEDDLKQVIEDTKPQFSIEKAAETPQRGEEVDEKIAKARQIKAKQNRDISRFTGQLQRVLKIAWIRPISMTTDLSCVVRVKLKKNGQVTQAVIIRSSGNRFFDRSALSAVHKASPLPLPNDQKLFEKNFKSFTFTFKPD